MVIVAISDAVVTGASALGGAVIGAAATLALDVLRSRRADRLAVRAATRSVLHELEMLSALLETAHYEARGASQPGLPEDRRQRNEERLQEAHDKLAVYLPVPPAWREHRDTLARVLADDAWSSVESAMRLFEVQGFPGPEPASASRELEWGRARFALVDARNELARHAGDTRP